MSVWIWRHTRRPSRTRSVDHRLHHYEASTNTCLASLELTTQAFERWRPSIEAAIEALQSTGIQGSSSGWQDRLDTAGILRTPGSVLGRPPAPHDTTDGSHFGHRYDNYLWDSGCGYSIPAVRCPVTGTWNPQSSPSFSFHHDPLRQFSHI